MADSTITLTSSSYQGRQNRVVFEQFKDIANNRSRIHWTFYSEGGSSSYYTTGPVTITIDGQQAYYCGQTSYSTRQFPAAKGSVEGDVYVSHNTDGNKTISVSLSTAIYYDTVNTYSSNWTLSSIPRYPTANQSLNSKTLTSIKMNWSSDSIIDYLWYSTNGGANWTGVDVTDGTSGTYTISNLSPNTTYSIKTRLRRRDSQLSTDTGNLSVTTYDIGRLANISNFNHGDNVILSITNPSGIALGLTMKIGNIQILTRIVTTGNNTIEFTQEELDSIYRLYGSGNELTATFILTTAGYTDSKNATITLTGNQKTGHVGVNSLNKRAQVYYGLDGTVKKMVEWVGNNGRKRCI